MYVIKRGNTAPKKRSFFDKISSRINILCEGLDENFVDPPKISQKVVSGMYPGITTVQLDNLAAEIAVDMTGIHPDYAVLAAPSQDWRAQSLDLQGVLDMVLKHADKINAALDYQRDFDFNYFGFKTLEQSYLMKIGEKVVERPQHMMMRVALAIHGEDFESAFKAYDYTSRKLYTHAGTTLLNAGTLNGQLSSFFQVQMKEDSIEGIYDTVATCARISKASGSFQKIRASGSYIAGTNGTSNGIIPMLRVFNDAARFITPGARKVKGTYAVYLEPWHADIFEFIDLSKNSGEENLRARHLLLGLWIPDIFMKRVEENGEWSLMCPNECPRLDTTYGKEFEELYLGYEKAGKARKTVSAQKLWFSILDAQIESGMPFMCYKDAANEKNNQKNLGEVSSTNIASIALPKCVDAHTRTFNFDTLHDIVKVVIQNLDKMIDVNKYVLEEAKSSALKHRALGLGVQGLADVFLMMHYPFDSPDARQLNKDIFESIYFAALEASNELAQKNGTYPSYEGSPISQGILQHDLWNVEDSDRLDWATLRANIKAHGVRNSVLVAPMPTTTTSQFLGNNDGIEPYQSMIFTHRAASGECHAVNPHLLKDLIDRVKDMLTQSNGSVQKLPLISDDLKKLYKTVWEISHVRLSSMHFYCWKKGLKTGMQYLKTSPLEAMRLTMGEEAKEEIEEEIEKTAEDLAAIACSLENPEACVSCSG
ncbi:ribonucleotide reductase [Mucor lusitanicus]